MDYLYTIVHNLPVQYTLHIAFALYYLFVCVFVYVFIFVHTCSCNRTCMKARGQLVGVDSIFPPVCLRSRNQAIRLSLVSWAMSSVLN